MEKDKSKYIEIILNHLKKSQSMSVGELVNVLKTEQNASEDESLMLIRQLQKEGKLIMTKTPSSSFLLSKENLWFISVCFFSIFVSLLVLIDVQSFFLLNSIKYIIGTFYLFFIPGFTLTKALYYSNEISNIEKIGLSFGFSLAVVPLTGLILTYTPFKLTIVTITASLFFEIMIISIFALFRSHSMQIKGSKIISSSNYDE